MKRIVVDLDDTLTKHESSDIYRNKMPNVPLVKKLRDYKNKGFEIIIHTARNMHTFQGQVGKINAHTLPIIIEWLETHDIPYDEIYVAKPWCGKEGFYIDDRAIRPSEFLSLSFEEITKIIQEK